MLSFNTDQEFFNWLLTTDYREGQFSEGEIIYMLKRFKEEYRKLEGKKRSLEHNNLFLTNKLDVSFKENESLVQKMKIIDCKNQVLLAKFKNGISFWERITGKVKY
jgi:hypothetical protein